MGVGMEAGAPPVVAAHTALSTMPNFFDVHRSNNSVR